MRGEKSQLKKYISSMLVLAGRLNYKMRIPVLLYHSIDYSNSVISISPEEFKVQMEYLKYSGYKTISLPEYVQYLHSDKKISQKTVILTFDDGFKNNYSEAFPIFKKYGFRATIFLATDYIDNVCSWKMDNSIPKFALLSWSEIQDMSEYGIDFGSHSCSHPFLTRLKGRELRDELLNRKITIEEKLKKPVKFLCHPYGDTNELTQRAAKECGYIGVFGDLDFSLSNSKDKLYDLSRIGTKHFTSLQDFKAGLLGMYRCYIKMKKLTRRT